MNGHLINRLHPDATANGRRYARQRKISKDALALFLREISHFTWSKAHFSGKLAPALSSHLPVIFSNLPLKNSAVIVVP